MPIKLTDEMKHLTASERAAIRVKTEHTFENDIVAHRKFDGKHLSAAEFAEFQKIVNARRPYCAKDFIPQTFIPDLSKIR